MSQKEVEEINGYITKQYKACQNGRPNNFTELLRASQQDSGIKLLIDDYCRELPTTIAGFNQTRTSKDEYIATVLCTIDKSPKDFFGKGKSDHEKLYKGVSDKSKKSYKTLKNRADAMWTRLSKAQEVCKARVDLNGYLTKDFVTGKCFTKIDGWLLTAFFFDYAFRKLGIEETDDNYEKVGSICHKLYVDVDKLNKGQKKLRDDKEALLIGESEIARSAVATDNHKYADLVYLWTDTFISSGSYGSFKELNARKWRWLEDLFTLNFPELSDSNGSDIRPKYREGL